MIKYNNLHVSKIALAVLVGGMSLGQPAYAETHSVSIGDHTISVGEKKHHNDMDRVEQRIKTMHDKLNLTAGQESQWNDVAQVMRSNETDIHQLVISRHENEPANAVEDLKSYETIADAHADGLKKLIPVFTSFYNNLSAEQQTRADSLFGKFEGRSGHKVSSARTRNNVE
jgi:protein CpxP